MRISIKIFTFLFVFLFCLIPNSAICFDDQYAVSYTLRQYCGNDVNVRIPDFIDALPVTSIGERCFAGNEYINSVTIPDTVEEIGCYAFTETNIETISFEGDYLRIIGDGAFSLTLVNDIVLPERVDSLGNALFMSCYCLENIRFPENIYSIPMYMFFECVGLKEIELPSTIEVIGDSAFYGCTELKTIALPENLLTIDESAFESCGFEEVKLPSQIQFIYANAFANCESLSYCSLPSTLLYIDKTAFDGCSPDFTLGVVNNSLGHCFALENAIPYEIIDTDF